ncbi:T-cell receptor-associated transmembrane adapter 1 [Rhinophrynus dorsalis]
MGLISSHTWSTDAIYSYTVGFLWRSRDLVTLTLAALCGEKRADIKRGAKNIIRGNQRKQDLGWRNDCKEFLVALIIMGVAFILSVTINIVCCILRHRKAKEAKYYSQSTIRYDQQYIEDNPIYGNLNQPILEHIDESCYEPMSTPHDRNRDEVKVEPVEQMCYASLDLSPKKPRKIRKKKVQSTDNQNCVEDRQSIRTGNVISRSSIYLNSEQLTAESHTGEDLIHDDPIRIYHLLQNARNNVPTVDQNQMEWTT